MTDDKFNKILYRIRDEMGLADDATLFNYLESIGREEMAMLTDEVSIEFKVDTDVFMKKLLSFLLIRAKPWANEGDIK